MHIILYSSPFTLGLVVVNGMLTVTVARSLSEITAGSVVYSIKYYKASPLPTFIITNPILKKFAFGLGTIFG